MNMARKVTAISSGVLVPIGYIAACGVRSNLIGPLMVAGLIMGIGIATSMINNPEKTTARRIKWLIVPSMLVLIVLMAFINPPKVPWVAAWALTFTALQVAHLHTETRAIDGRESPAESK